MCYLLCMCVIDSFLFYLSICLWFRKAKSATLMTVWHTVPASPSLNMTWQSFLFLQHVGSPILLFLGTRVSLWPKRKYAQPKEICRNSHSATTTTATIRLRMVVWSGESGRRRPRPYTCMGTSVRTHSALMYKPDTGILRISICNVLALAPWLP